MEIAANILKLTTSGGIKKTHMMYGALLSHPQLTEYLELLTSGGLMKYVRDEKLYYITEKGRYFLKLSSEMGRMLPLDKPTKADRPWPDPVGLLPLQVHHDMRQND